MKLPYKPIVSSVLAALFAHAALPMIYAAVPNPDVSGGTATFNANKTQGAYVVPASVNKVLINQNVKIQGRIYINEGVARDFTIQGAGRTSVIQGTYGSNVFVYGKENAELANVYSSKSDGKNLTLKSFTSDNPRNWHVRATGSIGYVNNVGFQEPTTDGNFSTDALSGILSLKEVTNCTFNMLDDGTYFRYVDAPFINCTYIHRSNGALIQVTHGNQSSANKVELRDLSHITSSTYNDSGNKQGIAGWASTQKEDISFVQTVNLTGTFTESKQAGITINAPFFTFGSNKSSDLGANDFVKFKLEGSAATTALATRVSVRQPQLGHKGQVTYNGQTISYK